MTDELSPTVAARRFLVPTREVTGSEHSVRSSQEPAEALRLDGGTRSQLHAGYPVEGS